MNPTAIVADDEPLARASLVDALAKVWPELQVVDLADDGPSALLSIQRLQPDYAFLDIRMPGMSGLQVAETLAGATRVVLVTAYDQHALTAFEQGAADYVLKPVELARLATVVQRLKSHTKVQPTPALMASLTALSNAQPTMATHLQWIKASVGTQIRLIHVDDVHYFESDSRYTRVVTADSDALIRVPIKQLTQELDPQWFWQVHRNALVHLRHVAGVERKQERMDVFFKHRPERIKVSSAYQHLFRHM